MVVTEERGAYVLGADFVDCVVGDKAVRGTVRLGGVDRAWSATVKAVAKCGGVEKAASWFAREVNSHVRPGTMASHTFQAVV